MKKEVVVDDEMNGFFDDVLYTGLPFADDNKDLQGVTGVYALMGVAETTPVSAAYYDFVTTIGASGDAMAGDVDDDGNVDRDDVNAIMHSILNGSMPTQGDTDGDGEFTTHDFLEVLCKVGGLGRHGVGRQRGRVAAAPLRQQRRQAHLGEEIERVVAGGAVGAERDVDPRVPQPLYRAKPRCQLQVRLRAVHDLHAAVGAQRDLVVLELRHVHGDQSRRDEP